MQCGTNCLYSQIISETNHLGNGRARLHSKPHIKAQLMRWYYGVLPSRITCKIEVNSRVKIQGDSHFGSHSGPMKGAGIVMSMQGPASKQISYISKVSV